MSCLSKSLIWFGGIGASLILAYGSIYLLYTIKDRNSFRFSRHEKNRDKSNDSDDETNSLSDNDSSIEIILMYKQVPAFIFDLKDGFKEIQEQTCTLIEEKFVHKSIDYQNPMIDKFDYQNVSCLKNSPDVLKYRNISIHGYSENVMQASKMINDIVASIPLMEHKKLQVLSSQIPLIIGVNGSMIKSLCRRSGAEISVNHKKYPQQFTIDIYGTQDQIRKAYHLIYELLNEDFQFKNQRPLANTLFFDGEEDFVNYNDVLENDNDLADSCDNSLQLQTLVRHRTSLSLEQIAYLTETLDQFDSTMTMNPLSPLLQVFVSHVQTPQCFYVQIVENKRSIRLDDLHNDMNKFYLYDDNQQSCRCDPKSLKENDLVAIKQLDDGDSSRFYRGYVTNCKLSEENADVHNSKYGFMVEVFYTDLGITAQHPIEHLFYLNANFLIRLPFQAIQCSLYDVDDDQQEWTPEEIDYFRELTREGLWEVITVRSHGRRQINNDVNNSNVKAQCCFLVELFSKPPQQAVTINVGKQLMLLRRNFKNKNLISDNQN